jgi:hypothetical protein
MCFGESLKLFLTHRMTHRNYAKSCIKQHITAQKKACII